MKEIYYIKRQETKNNPTRRSARCPLISFAKNGTPLYAENKPEGELPLSLNFYVRTHVNLTRVNKIQTMFESWRWDVYSKVRGYFCWILARFKTFLVKSILIALQQKERDRQRSAAKKLIHNNSVPEKKNNRKGSGIGENRGEFDDLISALRTGDVFGDELSKMKGRRRTAPPKQARRVDNVSERERASPKIATKFQH